MSLSLITPDTDFLPKLLAVAEALDAAQQPKPVELRERLLASAATLCESQGIVATPEAMAAEVDLQLATAVSDKNPTPHFSWRRPISRVAREQETAKLDRWPRHLFRPTVPGEAAWRSLPWSVCGLASVSMLTHVLAVGSPAWDGWVAGAFLLGSGTLGLRDWVRRLSISTLPRLSCEKQTTWRGWYVARVHVRECLGSTGELLRRDGLEIERRIARRDAEISAEVALEQREKQWVEMANWPT